MRTCTRHSKKWGPLSVTSCLFQPNGQFNRIKQSVLKMPKRMWIILTNIGVWCTYNQLVQTIVFHNRATSRMDLKDWIMKNFTWVNILIDIPIRGMFATMRNNGCRLLVDGSWSILHEQPDWPNTNFRWSYWAVHWFNTEY